MNVFLSLLLVICLLISAMPVAALEAGDGMKAENTTVKQTENTDIEEGSVTQAEDSVFQLDADCQILRYVDEAVFNEGDHIARLPAEESLSSYVFQNRDGTRTVYYMNENVKFLDSSGFPMDKDLTLIATQNGYITTRNDVSLALASNPSDGVHLSYEGEEVNLIPQRGGSTAQLSNNTVTYPNYFGKDMSLVYIPALTGVKENIVLNTHTGINSFTFMLNTGGLNLYQTNGHYYLAESTTSEIRFELSDIVTFDATGRSRIGTIIAETITAGQTYRLTFTADEAFLADESTTYPVTIASAITVSDDTYGTNAIERVAVYKGQNTDTGKNNLISYSDSTFSSAHTIIRLMGLLETQEYLHTSTDDITSVKFYVQGLGGSSAEPVRLYAMQGNANRTETNLTLNNIESSIGTAYDTVTLTENQPVSFNITELVKDWKEGKQDAEAGFVLVSETDRSADTSTDMSGFSAYSSQLYAVMVYATDISLNYGVRDVDSGATTTLTASSPLSNPLITWSSSNTAIATVTKTGPYTCQINGVKSGEATITATLSNGSKASCLVYVTITDGVYFIRYSGGLYVGVEGGMVANSTTDLLAKKSSGPAQLRQLWKIQYLTNGYYSIRSMYRLGMALHVTGDDVDVATLKTDLSGSDVPADRRWKIIRQSNTYAFQYAGTSSLTMRPAPGALSPGTDVIAGVDPSYQYTWSLDWASVSDQLLLINTEVGLPATNAVRYITPGETLTLSNLKLTASFVSKNTNNQSFTWASQNSNVATVNQSTGSVTGLQYGKETKIIVNSVYNNTVPPMSYTISVKFSPSSPPLKPQEQSSWCWVATAQMLALNYNPSITATQCMAVRAIYGSVANNPANPNKSAAAANYFLNTVPGNDIEISYTEYGTILTEQALINYLDNGHSVVAHRGFYWADDVKNTRMGGHAILICGYREKNGVNQFFILDPLPLNEGKTQWMSYEEICDSRDSGYHYFWDAVIAADISYLNNTINIKETTP